MEVSELLSWIQRWTKAPLVPGVGSDPLRHLRSPWFYSITVVQWREWECSVEIEIWLKHGILFLLFSIIIEILFGMFPFVKCISISVLQPFENQHLVFRALKCLNKLYCLFNRHRWHFSALGICHENVGENNGLQSSSSTHWHFIIINLCIICDYKNPLLWNRLSKNHSQSIITPSALELYCRRLFFRMTSILRSFPRLFLPFTNQLTLTTYV